MRSVLFLALIFVAYAFASNPLPDTSEKCTACKEEVEKLDIKWSSGDSVDEVVKNLKEKCKEKEGKHWLKREACDLIVKEFVKIPPAIFEGLDSLAWDVPLGLCANIKKCEMECCAAEAAPEQVHLSLAAEDRSIMGVTWVTLNKNETMVQYGLSADDLSQTSQGDTTTYGRGHGISGQGGWVGTIHRAVMTDLKPASTYYYRVGSASASSWSEVFSFKTFDPNQKKQTFALDVVIHSGDISYADGFESHWDVFFNKIQPIAARVPYMVTPGNHEFWYDFAAYKARFFMPSVGAMPGSGSGDNMYYSWKYGQASFYALNSETAVDTQDFHKDELKFLANGLGSVDRTATPFLIAHFHRPLYCSNDKQCTGYKEGFVNKLTKQAEDIFYSNQVDLCLTGHVHAYERSFPTYQSKAVTQDLSAPTYSAPIYIVQGASGNREGNKHSWPEPAPAWSASHSGDIGYGIMTIENADSERPTLNWSFRVSESNEETDAFTLEK
eukprot:GSChrysophyteH1.ASY1.ANO1.690.1 assembled CDS